jgi:hypothetical protein
MDIDLGDTGTRLCEQRAPTRLIAEAAAGNLLLGQALFITIRVHSARSSENTLGASGFIVACPKD